MFPASFWLYLVSRFGSATAMMMLRAAVAWHVYALSRSAFLLGLIGLVQFVPALALTLVGGALADSYDRRRIMMRAQVVPLVSAAALFLATRSGAVTLPLLYGVILLVAVAGAFESPSRMALLPTLVERDVFPRAVTIAATNQALAFATGPAACGWVIAAADVGAVYAVDAALVATSLLALAFLRSSGTPVARRVPGLQAVREGLAFVRRHEVVLGCVTLDQVSVVLRSTTIQLSTPDPLRGRVSGVNMLFISASNQVGAAESGFVAALTDATFSVVSGGIACLAVVAIVAIRLPALRRYRTDRVRLE